MRGKIRLKLNLNVILYCKVSYWKIFVYWTNKILFFLCECFTQNYLDPWLSFSVVHMQFQPRIFVFWTSLLTFQEKIHILLWIVLLIVFRHTTYRRFATKIYLTEVRIWWRRGFLAARIPGFNALSQEFVELQEILWSIDWARFIVEGFISITLKITLSNLQFQQSSKYLFLVDSQLIQFSCLISSK